MGRVMIQTAFLRALSQMGDPTFRSVLLRGIGLAICLLVGAAFAVASLVGALVGTGVVLPWLGAVAWSAPVLSVASGVLVLGLSVFLMVPVASAMTSLFLDEVAEAVEARYYPGLPATPEIPFSDALADTLSFLGLLAVVNLCALLIYVIFAPFAPLLFWTINGFLLGREYFQMAAMRRLGRAGARALRKRHTLTIWGAGALMAVPLSIPVVNLLIPVFGAAAFTHLFHLLSADPSARTNPYPAR